MDKVTVKKDNVKTRSAREVTNDEIAEALRNTNGLIASAAVWLKEHKGAVIDRSTISKRIKKSEELQDVLDDVTENTLDFAEGSLFNFMKAGNLSAIMFYLKCKGKKRGYVERQEVTADIKAEVRENPFKGMSVDEIKALAHAQKTSD